MNQRQPTGENRTEEKNNDYCSSPLTGIFRENVVHGENGKRTPRVAEEVIGDTVNHESTFMASLCMSGNTDSQCMVDLSGFL